MNSTTQQSALIAERIKNDPRVLEAKRLILEAVNEHRSAITQISEADPNLKVDYDAMLAAFGKIRGGNLYFPYLASGVGNGPFVELADGSVKLDFITGIGVHGFGHSDPRLIRAGIDAALADTVMQGNLQQGTISYEFAKLLVSLARESGSNIEHCFLSTSGAMANENALKIAFQKHFPAKRVLAFDHCFAGRTLALAQVTDKAAYRIGLPETIAVDYLPFFDQKNAQESTRRTIQVMRELLHRHPNDYACLWTELIQGEGG
ncbi:MAG TPA: aminotransferase class III-fold pyridoxal phosphate-dependent enzyme, partial [Pirellulaceae bacterium]|nr:aminotransferase class III-fold pyridoxal phosphate-dependent enzyme [Pirellulaceae bacterium]